LAQAQFISVKASCSSHLSRIAAMRKAISFATFVGTLAVPEFPPHVLTKCPGNGTAGPVLGGVDFVDLLEHYEQTGSKKVPDKGTEKFTHTLPDQTYALEYVFHFKSQENADKFAQNSSRYLPGGGGY